MTLAPLVDPAIRGVEGKDPDTNSWCSVPGCVSRAQHRHHIWARSFLRGQPLGWVSLPSGSVIGNLTGLCIRHHEMVTGNVGGHKAHIRTMGDILEWWELVDGEWHCMGPLYPQPPVKSVEKPQEKTVSKMAHHVHLKEGETCGSCGYTKPEKREPGPKRATSTWTVKVPEDAEIGAEILDDWVDQFAVMMGFGDASKGITRYHVLAPVLAWAMQNRFQFIEELKGEVV